MSTANTSADSGSDVHPIELTVQALLETPLETLNLNLKSLYESQMILHTILYKMECTLMETANNLRPGSFPLKDQVVPSEFKNGEDETCGENNYIDDDCNDNNSNVRNGNSEDDDQEDYDYGEDGIRIDHSDLDGELDLNEYLAKMNRIRRKVKSIEKIIDDVEARIGRIEHTMNIN